MAKLAAVLLDLDDTLYDYGKCNGPANAKAFSLIAKKYGLGLKKAERVFLKARKEVKALIPKQAASHSRLLYFKRMIELVGGKTDASYSLLLEREFWAEYFSKMRLERGVKGFLKMCRNNGLKIAVVTNLTAQIQLKKCKRLGIGKLVDLVVTSEEAGAEKPSVKIIRVALKRLGCKKSRAILVGDSDDRKAAKKAGIRFVQAGQTMGFGKIQNMLSGK